MKRRFRWYLLALKDKDIDFVEVSMKMLALPYSEGNPTGFRLEKVHSTRIEGEFVEELHADVEAVSPLGGVYKYSTIHFNLVKFQLMRYPLALRLTDPPRSLKGFFSELRGLMGMNLETPQIDVRTWLNQWSRREFDVVVQDVLLSDVTVGRATRAAIRFSGQGDVRQDASRFLSGREPLISCATLEFTDGDSRGTCEIRANCSAVVNSWRPMQIADDLWSAFLEAVK
ncbi:hypothetical protein [Synechococcus sp. CCY 0621]|uniref:hypothetical protein n=1 Tax=Synechococcus sp. CCY 0621 TaxID=2815603 RepID=UPI001C22B891|nr:hypothetical protein [Synechococcus sp. CCY 0621]